MKRFAVCFSMVCVFAVATSVEAQQPFEPTKAHKILEKDKGDWDVAGKMWMPGSDEAIDFKGSESNKMVGGLWVISDFKGNFGGMEFTGHATLGYDVDSKKYVGTWMDSFSPNAAKMSGTYDADKNTLTMMSVTKVPGTDQKQKSKNVVHYKDEDTRIMTMYNDVDGEMVKSMVLTYTRKKKSGAK